MKHLWVGITADTLHFEEFPFFIGGWKRIIHKEDASPELLEALEQTKPSGKYMNPIRKHTSEYTDYWHFIDCDVTDHPVHKILACLLKK
jgi:hypothetical protein